MVCFQVSDAGIAAVAEAGTLLRRLVARALPNLTDKSMLRVAI